MNILYETGIVGFLAWMWLVASIIRTGRRILKDSENSQARYTGAHMEILRLLRKGDKDSALERLEQQLDKDIVSLSPDYYDEFRISERTKKGIDTVLRQARQYCRRARAGTAPPRPRPWRAGIPPRISAPAAGQGD